MRRDLRWITDALQYARYKQPRGGVPITCLVDASIPESDSSQPKTDSTSSNMDYLPTPSPSPEFRRRKAISGEASLSSLKLIVTKMYTAKVKLQTTSSRLSARVR